MDERQRMMKVIKAFLIILFLNPFMLFSQETPLSNDYESVPLRFYSYSIFDGTLDSFTMRQMDLNYFATSRLINRGVEEIFADKTFLKIKVSDWINYTWPTFVYAITHEEGHRSILTAQNIGSISQPFFNLHGAAYVKGVTDQTLINLRDTKKDSFIRMYTAGIESDYMMSKRGEMFAAFDLDSFSILYPDYLFRRMMICGYLCTGIIYHGAEEIGGLYNWITGLMNLTEEKDELARDICGFDTFGATKALFEDNYQFRRYVQYSDLSKEEKNFLVWRVGYRSYLNFLSLFLFTKPYINITESFSVSGSVGYALAPFGDFIDENLYFRFKTESAGSLNFYLYARQAQNYKNWFPSFGLGIIEFAPFSWLSISSQTHIWWQPEKLNFYSTSSFFGGAFEITGKFFLTNKDWKTPLQKIGLSTSLLVKSKGFMPEIEQHDKYLRFSLGIEIGF